MQSTIVTNENEKTTTITGYEAELIKLLAERARKTPQEFVISFFEIRCNPVVRTDDFCACHVDAKTGERTFAGLAPSAGANA